MPEMISSFRVPNPNRYSVVAIQNNGDPSFSVVCNDCRESHKSKDTTVVGWFFMRPTAPLLDILKAIVRHEESVH